MKVLQICLKPPFPEVDGGCKAMHSITQGMIDKGVGIKVLTISTHKHPFLKDKMSQEYLDKTRIEYVFVDTKVSALGAFFNLFSSKSYNLERFYDKKFESLIAKELKKEEYNIVLLETFFVTGYIDVIRENSDAKIVYQAQNIEHDIWNLNAKKAKGLKRWYLSLLAKRLKKAEIANIAKVDAIAPITNNDGKRFRELGFNGSMITIPFGVNMSDYKFKPPHSGDKVFHIGSMDWLPNQTGVQWLLDNVWKGVSNNCPKAELNLAGRHMPDWLKSNSESNVNVVGEVDSAIDFINDNNIMVVPLLAGSGMRIKIIEGMVLGKTVIATTIAAEGVSYTNKKNIIIADSPQEMEDAIVYYLNNKEEQIEIGKAARVLMESNYDNQVIVVNLIKFCKELTN